MATNKQQFNRPSDTNTNTPFPMLRMSRDLLQLARHKNFVFSPCSIQLAMCLLAHGAGGSTLDELLTFLQVETLDQLTFVASKLVDILSQPQLDDSQTVHNPTSVGGAWTDASLPPPDDSQRGHKRASTDHSLPLPDYSQRGRKRTDPSLPLRDYSDRGHKRAWTNRSFPLLDDSQRGHKLTSVGGDRTGDSSPLRDDSQRGSKISFVGGAWIDHSLNLSPSFISCAENIYKVKAEAVNFKLQAQQVVNMVNKWAEESTRGLIKSILTNLSPDSILVLANALYFKGTWEEPFSKSLTRDSDFYLHNQETVQVPFMSSGKRQFIQTFDDVKVLRLPYNKVYGKEAAFSMYIILPHQRDGLRSLVDKVGSDPCFLEKYTTNNTVRVRVGKFMVPKFKMTYYFEASPFLKGVGLRSCFSMEAEFHNMLLNPKLERSLSVSEVHHKSYIEIDEEGTEAAAVTVLTMAVGCSRFMPRPTVVDFVADHPFMFMIKDDHSGMALFLGHVINPLLM